MIETSDRLPPHKVESEQGLLGCVLLDGEKFREAFDLGIRDESFYDLRCRTVWRVIREIDALGAPLNILTVLDRLKDQNEIENAGGPLGVALMESQTPSAGMVSFFAADILRLWDIRRTIAAASVTIQSAHAPGANPASLIAALEESLSNVRRHAQTSIVSSAEAMRSWIGVTEKRVADRKAGKRLMGIATGFWKLDAMSSGLLPGSMVVIAARPSVGKTAMLCNLILNCAIHGGVKSTVVSLETTRDKLIDRLASDACSIEASKLRDGEPLTESEWRSLVTFSAKVTASPLCFTKDVFDADSIASVIARHAESGTQLFLIDYLQIIRPSTREERKAYSVGAISTQLKQAAIKHNVCVVALAQLKRTEKEEAIPCADDIADSDQIFRDADLLWLLHRPKRLTEPEKGMVVVAKNKEGETSIVPMDYTPRMMRWTEKRPEIYE